MSAFIMSFLLGLLVAAEGIAYGCKKGWLELPTKDVARPQERPHGSGSQDATD